MGTQPDLEAALIVLCELYDRVLVADDGPDGTEYALIRPELLALLVRPDDATVH